MRVAIVTDTNSGISVAEGRELGVFVLTEIRRRSATCTRPS